MIEDDINSIKRALELLGLEECQFCKKWSNTKNFKSILYEGILEQKKCCHCIDECKKKNLK